MNCLEPYKNMQGKKKGRILLNLKPCPYLTFLLIFVFSFTKVEGKVIFNFFQKNKKNIILHKNAILWKVNTPRQGSSQK
jgi:hypothetical protein